MADEKNPRELVRIRHPKVFREGWVPRSALAYLDGWREVDGERPRRARRAATRETSAASEASESTNPPAEADATGHTPKNSEEE